MVYFIIKNILRFYFFWILSIDKHGFEFIPKNYPAIIAANHPGFLDGLLIVVLLKRRVHTFAKAKVFNSKFKRLFLRSVGGIPVGDKKTNKNALFEAQRLLEKNNLLLIFPEGKINAEPDLLPFKNGFLRLADKCNIPVVPVVIMGSEKSLKAGQFFPRPSDIYVRFLEPLSFNISKEVNDGLSYKKALQCHVEKVRNNIQHKLNYMRELNTNS